MKVFKISVAALAIAGLCAGLTGNAHAQAPATTPVVKPFSVKLGAHFLTDDASGSTTFSLGLGYDFLKTQSDSPIIVQGYVDYFGGTDDTTTGAGGVSIKNKFEYGIGVGVAGRYQFMKDPTANFMPYGFLGVGVYSVKAQSTTTTPGSGSTPTTVTSTSKTQTGLGGKLGLGAEMKNGLFGEAEYSLLPEANGINGSGFGIRLGYRF